ncbi:hypothetical protein [Sphingobium sp.]|uniref:hypothetical protein n=1 Tax=Sphingobium sp. TaxID=1912891 RepID=UPI0026138BA8|nr:hypothetical protein [Sphingobium sp.]
MRSANIASSPLPDGAAPANWLRHSGRIALLGWLICCVVLLARGWPMTQVNFFDPDDALRLEEVRDWIAGQSWFDVTQYRVNPPDGAPMHWSRIVDLPIAAMILIARPLFGPVTAELLATLIVPLLLLGGLTFATYIGNKWIGGRPAALLGTAMLLTTPSILVQFPPYRIDHHGWQIMLSAFALCGLFDPRARRGGIVMGGALATWLAISSEGLPYVAFFLGAAGILHLRSANDTARMVWAAAILGAAGLTLAVATRGLVSLHAVQCDALTVPYLFPLVALAIAMPIADRLVGHGDWRRRLIVGGVGAGAAIVTLLLVGGPCLSGDPFQTLGPLAYRVWYMAIMEGRPVWEQEPFRMGVIIVPPIGGLVATLIAAYAHRTDAQALTRWLIMALLLAGATLVAVMVMRALSVAHLLAIPGLSWLVLTLVAKIQASSRSAVRIFGTVSIAVLTPFGLSAVWVGVATLFESPADAAPKKELTCSPGMLMRDVRVLPPSLLFAPLDIGPTILVRTPHRIVATGHHRNASGITTVIRAYTARPDAARAIIAGVDRGKGADYLLTCDDLNEYRSYIKIAPNGLAAMLAKGRTPDWLEPLQANAPLHIYRIRRD